MIVEHRSCLFKIYAIIKLALSFLSYTSQVLFVFLVLQGMQ